MLLEITFSPNTSVAKVNFYLPYLYVLYASIHSYIRSDVYPDAIVPQPLTCLCHCARTESRMLCCAAIMGKIITEHYIMFMPEDVSQLMTHGDVPIEQPNPRW